MSRPFQFKQFKIVQEKAPMKVGTDGVLLGAWCSCEHANTILDAGAGTGLIALMLAQRNSRAQIDAYEINNEAFLDAQENISNSLWKKRIDLHLSPIQSITKNKYDLIITNPPFFKNDLRSPKWGKTIARHDDELNLDDLAILTTRLEDEGIFSGILPIDRFEELEKKLVSRGLKLLRLCQVFPNPEKPSHRNLFEFIKTTRSTTNTNFSELIIEEGGRHVYSKAYQDLTKEFYLNF